MKHDWLLMYANTYETAQTCTFAQNLYMPIYGGHTLQLQYVFSSWHKYTNHRISFHSFTVNKHKEVHYTQHVFGILSLSKLACSSKSVLGQSEMV